MFYAIEGIKVFLRGSRVSQTRNSYKGATITTGIICAILASVLAYSIVDYNYLIKDRDDQIASRNTQIADLQNQISGLNARVAELESRGAGTGISNQTQVSGKATDTRTTTQSGTIYFQSLDDQIKTSTPIINCEYSVFLVGGVSYDVTINFDDISFNMYYSLYVPLGIESFTADF